MDNLDTEVLQAATGWSAAGKRFVLVTVARTWGSAPRPPGAWMVLREDGVLHGSVSGGCIEDDLIKRMLAGEFRGEVPEVIRYGVSGEEANRFGLPCGGTLELMLEPKPDIEKLKQLADRIDQGELVCRYVTRGLAPVNLEPVSGNRPVRWDGRTLVTQHGPALRLLIIGAGQISRFLSTMAQALGYRVYICDPRDEYAEGWDVPGTHYLRDMPDDAVTALKPDAHLAVVALTHDPKLDDMALLEALSSPAFYVGALGSMANNDARRERLRLHFDLDDDQVARLHGPVGVSIGSRTPPEIAVSILAQMTAVKNAVAGAHSDITVPDMYACKIA